MIRARVAGDARGFTLVEVLVALVIVAVGMSAVLGALSSAADSTVYLRDRAFAQWVALNRVAEVRLQAEMPAKGKTSGETELAGRRWRWEQEVQEVEVPGLLRIDVRVQPADRPADARSPWLTTVSGIRGNAVAPLTGTAQEWAAIAPYETPGGQGGPGSGSDGNGNGDGNGDGDGNDGGENEPSDPEPPTE